MKQTLAATDGGRYKHPVVVMAVHELDGHVVPRAFRRPSGPRIVIDRILREEQAAALKAGGSGIRYTCRITNEKTGIQAQVHLFREDMNGEWFVEWPNE